MFAFFVKDKGLTLERDVANKGLGYYLWLNPSLSLSCYQAECWKSVDEMWWFLYIYILLIFLLTVAFLVLWVIDVGWRYVVFPFAPLVTVIVLSDEHKYLIVNSELKDAVGIVNTFTCWLYSLDIAIVWTTISAKRNTIRSRRSPFTMMHRFSVGFAIVWTMALMISYTLWHFRSFFTMRCRIISISLGVWQW